MIYLALNNMDRSFPQNRLKMRHHRPGMTKVYTCDVEAFLSEESYQPINFSPAFGFTFAVMETPWEVFTSSLIIPASGLSKTSNMQGFKCSQSHIRV